MSDCHIHGCRNLHTTCADCGRLVCEKMLPQSAYWIKVEDKMLDASKQYENKINLDRIEHEEKGGKWIG